ncbi:MAG: hypothetical protein ACKE51_05845 [Methylococcaceae bacterium]
MKDIKNNETTEAAMKIIKSLKIPLILGMVFFTGSAFAYSSTDVGEECLPLRFRNFSPPEQTKESPVPEVAPESEISFTVSGRADPTTIVVVAKDQPLKIKYVDRQSYFEVSAKLPAVLTGKYARIHLKAKAQKGFCVSKDGWLIKIKKAAEIEQPAPAATE